MCVQRHEFDKPSLDSFAHKIAADVDVARKFAAHWVFIDSFNQIVFLNFGGGVFLVAKILEGVTKIRG